MTTARIHAAGQFADPSVLARIAAGFLSLVRHVHCWYWRRAAIAELSALDDRTLKDIGLYRSTIPYFVHEVGSRGGSHHGGL